MVWDWFFVVCSSVLRVFFFFFECMFTFVTQAQKKPNYEHYLCRGYAPKILLTTDMQEKFRIHAQLKLCSSPHEYALERATACCC